MNKALFLDLDGTIITTKSGRTFPLHNEDWKIIPEILPMIKKYANMNYSIVIVTNQGGIESGFVAERNFLFKIEKICTKIEKYLKLKEKIKYFYCKHMESYYRKPNIGMAVDAALEYELILTKSLMVGDMESDAEFASNNGMAYISIEKVKEIYNAHRL